MFVQIVNLILLFLRFLWHRSWIPLVSVNQSHRNAVPKTYSRFLGIDMDDIPEIPLTFKTFALFVIIFFTTSIVFTIAYPLYWVLKRLSNLRVRPRLLTASEKTYLTGHPAQELADSLNVVGRNSFLTWLLASQNDLAICVENLILQTGTAPRVPACTLRHEAVHALQYKRYGGLIPFCALYFAHQITYWLWYWKDTSWMLAYAANPLEIEAHAFEGTGREI